MKTKIKTKSRFFKSIEEIERKREQYDTVEKQRERRFLNAVQRFFAGLSQLQQKYKLSECDEEDEITNYLIGFPLIQAHRDQYADMFNGTNRLVQVHCVNTGDVNQEDRDGRIITEEFNKHIINYGKEIPNLLKRICDEEMLCGVAISVLPETMGYIPNIERDIIFPEHTRMESKDLSFFWRPVNLSTKDLLEYANDPNEEDKDYINKEAIKGLLEEIEENIKNGGRGSGFWNNGQTGSYTKDYHNGYDEFYTVPTDRDLPAQWYYEVQEDGSLSKTLYIENPRNTKSNTEIMYIKGDEKILAEDLIDFASVQTMFGGDEYLESAVGYMQLIYNFSLEETEMINRAADHINEKLNDAFVLDENITSKDEANRYDRQHSKYRPAGLMRDKDMPRMQESFQLMDWLSRKSEQITGTTQSNALTTDGRFSAEFKQQVAVNGNKMKTLAAIRYRNMQHLFRKIFIHVLRMCDDMDRVEEIKPHGWEGVKIFKDCLKRKGVNLKKYSKRLGGRLKHLEVKIDKVLAPGDPQSFEVESESLMSLLQHLDPVARNLAKYKLLASRHGSDHADELMGNTQKLSEVTRDQEELAWLKVFKIKEKAGTNQNVEIENGTVHQLHALVMFQALEGMINKAQMGRPWTGADTLEASAINNHAVNLINAVMEQGYEMEAKVLYEQFLTYQEAIKQLSAVADQQSQQQSSSEDEIRAHELALKIQRLELDRDKFQLAQANIQRLQQSNQLNDQLKINKHQADNVFKAENLRIQDKNASRNER